MSTFGALPYITTIALLHHKFCGTSTVVVLSLLFKWCFVMMSAVVPSVICGVE